MKKPIFILLISLFICAVFTLLMINLSPAATNNKRDPKVNKTGNSNHFILRYVIGSGGVMVANAQNFHTATAGEMFAGGSHSDKYLAFAGFWAPMIAAGPSAVSSEQDLLVPSTFKLYQNYPNPFNPITTVEYDLPHKSYVTIEIFNSVGQRIRLLQSKTELPGHYRIVWDARDDYARLMGSGLYFYRLTAKSMQSENDTNSEHVFREIKKMVYIK